VLAWPSNVDAESMPASMGSVTVSSYAGSGYYIGSGSIWASSPNAAGSPDGNSALAFIFPGDSSRFLYLRDFGFNIPCNANIESITVRVTRRNSSTIDLQDTYVSVFNPLTLSIGSVNEADPGLWDESGSFETITYTHTTWGETLTPSLINNERFGFVIQAENTQLFGRSEALVDAVEMEVCYNISGAPQSDIDASFTIDNACFGDGSIIISATGGSGNYEYSIDNGMSWQGSNTFTGLSASDYVILVRNALDMSCQTSQYYINLNGDERIVQPGDAVFTCAPIPASPVTVAVDKLQALYDFYNNGEVGYDISPFVPDHTYMWTTADLGGDVFSIALDQQRNIYTLTSILYDLTPGGNIPVIISKIDAYTGAVSQLATLTGDAGGSGIEYDTLCEQLFAANLSDGQIYRIDPDNGSVLGSFDPGVVDNGQAGLAPMGERVMALAMNPSDRRLYYSLWNSDYNRTGIRNTIRSVYVNPGTCAIEPGTDRQEIIMPWTSEYGDTANASDFSMPVADMQFSGDGQTLIMAETGFDSSVPVIRPHESRIMRYTGSGSSWNLQATVPPGNSNIQYEFGQVSAGLNARGGVAFAHSGMDGSNCTIDNEAFILGTSDALRGADCNTYGCIYGMQYTPLAGGNSTNSVLLDIARDIDTQQKSVYGDVDMVEGCPDPLYCCPSLASSNGNLTICSGASAGTMSVSSQADSVKLVYLNSAAVDANEVYNSGIDLDSVEVNAGSAILSLANLNTNIPGTYYIYSIAHPRPLVDGCLPYDSFILTVRSNPVVSLNDPADRCVSGSDMIFTGSPSPGGGATGSFVSDAPFGFTDNGNGTAFLDISLAGVGIYTIDYSYTDVFGCSNTASSTVEVYGLPSVTISGPGTACESDGFQVFTGGPLPGAGTSGVFTSNAPFGFTDNGNGTASLNPSLAGPGIYTVQYQYTDNDGCSNTASTNIQIYADPTVTINDPADLCVSGVSAFYTGSPAPGGGATGSFSTTAPGGFTDNGNGTASLNPALSGAGIFNVSYTYTDANGCSSASTSSIQVFNSLANVVLSDAQVCGDFNFGSNSINLNSLIVSGPTGGSWADTDGSGGLSGSVFTATPAMEGNSYTFTYTITGGGPPGSDCETRSFTLTIDVNYCHHDLALIQTTSQITPVAINDVVSIQVSICNQGSSYVDSIQLTEYLPSCFSFTPNNNWVNSGADARITLTENNALLPVGGLPPAAFSPNNCMSINLNLQVTCLSSLDLIAYTEITASRDTEGTNQDSDSNQASDSAQERLVTPGSGSDDSYFDLFEDDHDPVTVPVPMYYDLAVFKSETSSGPYMQESVVSYEIRIENQGNIDASNIRIEDSPETGLVFVGDDSGLDPNVSFLGSGVYQIGFLAGGQSQVINIDFEIEEDFQGTILDNLVQIIQDDGNDIDSDPSFDENIDEDGDFDGFDDDESEVTIAVSQSYDLSIQKQFIGAANVSPGNLVEYRIDIRNEGSLNAANVEILDVPGAGLSFVSDNSGSLANVSALGGMRYLILSLPKSGLQSLEISFLLDGAYVQDSIDNLVRIVLDDGADIDSDPNQDETLDEDGDLDGFDDDESLVRLPVSYGFDIGDYVWEDRDGDGIQDFNEPGIEGVRVSLYNHLDFLVWRTFTDANGFYSFNDIVAGQYYLIFETEEEYKPSFYKLGSNDNIDNDVTGSFGEGRTELLSLLDENFDIDAGFVRCAKICGQTWYDHSRNNSREDDENGINGMIVDLYKNEALGWTLWESRVTGHKEGTPSDDGYYEFCAPPGQYYLKFRNPPDKLIAVLPRRGGSTRDSDVTGTYGSGTTNRIDILSGEEQCNIDAGYYLSGSIGDYVWYDGNNNGLRESNESGMSGVRINAIDTGGVIIASTLSDLSGRYILDYLEPGSYYVQVEVPEFYKLSPSNVGSDEMDSDIDGTNGYGTTDFISIQPEQYVPNIDIGLNSASLPVEWLDFRGSSYGSYNRLNWEVQSEIDVDKYELQRSENDKFYFETIAEIPYRQSYDSTNEYSFDDYDLDQQIEYYHYRVKQVDFNGHVSYSNIISLQSEEFILSPAPQIKMYPNPAVDQVMVEISHVTESMDEIKLELINTLGQKFVINGDALLLNEQNGDRITKLISVNGMPTGIYYLKISGKNMKNTQRLLMADQ